MRRFSPRWVHPVVSPWKARRHGTPVALLSTREHVLHTTLRLAYKGHTRRTQQELADLLDNPSRGAVHRNLRRLRQLEVIGFRSRRGRFGFHAIWIPRSTRQLESSLAGRRLPRANPGTNDSASTPSGTFLSASGVIEAWRPLLERHRGGAPPRTPRRRAVPRHIWTRCPNGHWTPLGRTSWRRGVGTLDGAWAGPCRRCGVEAVERIHVEMPVRLTAELEAIRRADPDRWSRLQRHAELLEADPATSAPERARLRREYLDRVDEPIRIDRPDQVGDVLEQLRRRREDPDRPVE
jgi:hypothetical protein